MVLAVSIPVKLLHESVGHVVTLELKGGQLYRGHLMSVEDNMNCLMESVKVTARDGSLTQLDQVFLKGSQIRFFVIPDALRHAPFLKNLEMGGRGGRGGRGGARGGRGGGRGGARPIEGRSMDTRREGRDDRGAERSGFDRREDRPEMRREDRGYSDRPRRDEPPRDQGRDRRDDRRDDRYDRRDDRYDRR